MDIRLKERLVGAALLVAAAVILIPEMLSGPPTSTQPSTAEAGAETPVRTVTIDFARDTPAEPSPDPQVVEEPAPPPEAEPPESEIESPSEAVAARPAAPARRTETVPEPQPDSAITGGSASAAPSTVVPATPAPAREPSPSAGAWAVQVGSFANPATAEALRQKLTGDGYTVFVVPFKSSTQTLYRVRVGPMRERGEADATVQKLKRAGTGATVVSN